jgi:hypothetical protein
VCGLDNGLELLPAELLFESCGRVGQDAPGRGDLDDVGTGANQLAHGAAAVVGARTDSG